MDPAHRDAHRRLWTDLVRRAQPGYAAAPASLLAFTAWQSGDGALANIALDRALADTPGYSMALLLQEALDAGMPPSAATLPMTPEEVAASYAARDTTPATSAATPARAARPTAATADHLAVRGPDTPARAPPQPAPVTVLQPKTGHRPRNINDVLDSAPGVRDQELTEVPGPAPGRPCASGWASSSALPGSVRPWTGGPPPPSPLPNSAPALNGRCLRRAAGLLPVTRAGLAAEPTGRRLHAIDMRACRLRGQRGVHTRAPADDHGPLPDINVILARPTVVGRSPQPA